MVSCKIFYLCRFFLSAYFIFLPVCKSTFLFIYITIYLYIYNYGIYNIFISRMDQSYAGSRSRVWTYRDSEDSIETWSWCQRKEWLELVQYHYYYIIFLFINLFFKTMYLSIYLFIYVHVIYNSTLNYEIYYVSNIFISRQYKSYICSKEWTYRCSEDSFRIWS